MTAAGTGRSRPRVVVVGAGFGGLSAVRGLARAPVDVVLVDRTNHHLFQPLLYQVATGILAPGEIAPALRKIMRRQRGTTVELGEVTDVDLDRREVAVRGEDGSTRGISYDYLVVATGAAASYFGHDEWARHLFPMKTLAHAVALRAHVLDCYERAAAGADTDQRRGWTTFVIVGAGPSGVELAGQLASLATELGQELGQNAEGADRVESRIVLIEGVDEVLAGFPPSLRTHAHARLTRMGVEVMLGARASDVDEHTITATATDGHTTRIEAHTVIWAAGVQASPLAVLLGKGTGAPVDHHGRVVVRPDCSLAGHPEVFAIGDLANHDNLPGLCEPAMQQGRYVAKLLHHRVSGTAEPGPFRYRDLGIMATISATDAIAAVFGLKLRGHLGKLAWVGVHIAFLVGWGNRVGVLVRWAFLLGSRTRAERMILTPVSGASDRAARLPPATPR